MSVAEHTGGSVAIPRWQRLLVSGSVLDDSGARTARDWAVDLAMFAIALGFGIYVLASTWDEHPTALLVVDIALGAAACGSLWLRRSFPLPVVLFVVAASTVSGLANGAALPALFNAAIRAPFRWLGGALVLAGIEGAVYPAIYPSGPNGSGYLWQATFGFALSAIAVSWGVFVRAQRELTRALRERADRAEADQALREEQAREAERRRIAAEMHDVLAHRLSLLSVHAGAMERWGDQVPAPLLEAVAVIRSNARTALGELRDVVGVLREGGDDAAPAQPTLERVPALVEESRAAGLRVTSSFDVPEALELPAAVGRTAYRVVQEGLTNARKHGGGGRVEVSVQAADASVAIAVRSVRPLKPAQLTEEARLGTGAGLLGLRERVELVGGELAHGFDADGDFVLRATLPWRAA